MRILDYKMYTFAVRYMARVHVRDDMGETTGQMENNEIRTRPVVVAKSRALAEAWVNERYNAAYRGHKDFVLSLIDEQAAPHLLIEYTG